MVYWETNSTDPYYNLAAEQYLFDCADRNESHLMFWQNDNAIIVGKHQNTLQEIDAAYVRERQIRVARRLSGGGTVYHDLGNLNFTWITDAAGQIDFARFCRPVVAALQALGIPAELGGRNDITVEGYKVSGNAQYLRQGRVMHHGTLLFRSDLDILGRALKPTADKISSKGIASVRSRVANLGDWLPVDMTILQLRDHLKQAILGRDVPPCIFTAAQRAAIEESRMHYASWEWNYAVSPPCSVHKERRFAAAGKIELHMNIADGCIQEIFAAGDFFGEGTALLRQLEGVPLEEGALRAALAQFPVDRCFHHLTAQELLELLL